MIFYPKKFRAIRQSRDLTQVKVAEALGIKYQSVQGWEHGKVNPSKQHIYKLADLLDCSPEDFASFEQDEILDGVYHAKDFKITEIQYKARESFRSELIHEIIFSDIEPAAKEKILKIIANIHNEK